MSKKIDGLSYKSAGVDYGPLDEFKRAAQEAAGQVQSPHAQEIPKSRGESVFEFTVVSTQNPMTLGHVEEGLGTKNLIADAVEKITGETFYDAIAEDTVASIVNDCITGGKRPVSVAMHLAVGDTAWFGNRKRWQALIAGWKKACKLSSCLWGPGETPILKDIIFPTASLLSGSCIGVDILPGESGILDGPEPGDQIILLGSSGLHANGLTLARELAGRLPDSYATPVAGGSFYGKELLTPSRNYVKVVEELLLADIHISYMANITGHGWSKIMRHPRKLHYVIKDIPSPQKIFDFIKTKGVITTKEMYGTFSMGAGFALFVRGKGLKRTLDIARAHSIPALFAGHVRESTNGEREVLILPHHLRLPETSLKIRH